MSSVITILMFGITAASTSSGLTQDIPVQSLSNPEVTFSYGFTRVAGIRELADSRVIVLDVEDRTVHVIDATWSTMVQVGRQGSGPGEYMNPFQLFALPGDSSAILDRHYQRLLLLTPDAVPGEFISPRGAGLCPACRLGATGINLVMARATDGRGNWYGRAPPIVANEGTLRLADSAAIERWTSSSSTRDTIGFVPYALKPGTMIAGGDVGYPSTGVKAFPTSVRWSIASDGTLAVVLPEPYRVDFYLPDGTIKLGAAISHDPVRVSDGHCQRWREEWARARPVMTVGPDGGSGQAMRAPRPMEPDWPTYMPPYLYDAAHREPVRFAPDGRLWIERVGEVGELPFYDILDQQGRLLGRVQLRARSQIIGFGQQAVYVVRRDEFDLEYLERYNLPAESW